MSEQAPAIVGIAALAVDCHDPAGLAAWWSRVLGGEVEVDDDGDATLRAPGLIIDFLRVPEAKTVKNRLHLDLRSSDLAEATTQAWPWAPPRPTTSTTRAAGRSCATPRATSSASSAPGPQGKMRNQRGSARTSEGGPSTASLASSIAADRPTRPRNSR
jgi:hypothetical protein